jgi:hypothetical protein
VSSHFDVRQSANEPGPGEEGRIKSFAQLQRCLPMSRVGGTFVKQPCGVDIARDEQRVAPRQKR